MRIRIRDLVNPGSGIRDGNIGTGINIPDPQHRKNIINWWWNFLNSVTLETISLVEKVVGKNAEVVGTVNHPSQRTNLKIRKHLRVSGTDTNLRNWNIFGSGSESYSKFYTYRYSKIRIFFEFYWQHCHFTMFYLFVSVIDVESKFSVCWTISNTVPTVLNFWKKISFSYIWLKWIRIRIRLFIMKRSYPVPDLTSLQILDPDPGHLLI